MTLAQLLALVDQERASIQPSSPGRSAEPGTTADLRALAAMA